MVSVVAGAFPAAQEAVGNFVTALSNGSGIIELAKTAIAGLWTIIQAHPIIATVAAVGTLIFAFSSLYTSAEEANTEMENSFTVYENAKKKVEDINTELQNAQTELDKLSAKDSLTFVEEQQLEDLREAVELLGIQADLAEREAKKAAKDAASSALTAYNKNYGKHGGAVNQDTVDELYNYRAYDGAYGLLLGDDKDLNAMLAAYKGFAEKRDEAYDEVKGFINKSYDELSDEEKYAVDSYNDYKEFVDDISDSLFEQVGQLAEYQEAFQSLPVEDLTDTQKIALDEISASIAAIYQQLDPAKWKQINFDKFFNSEALSTVKQELINMAKESNNLGITVEDVVSRFPELEAVAAEAGFTIEDIVANVNSEAEILNMDVVTEQIKDKFAEGTEDAVETVEAETDASVTVDTEVDVETDTSNIDAFNEWIDSLDDEYKVILNNLMLTTDTSGWGLVDYQEYLNNTTSAANGTGEALTELETNAESVSKTLASISAANSLLSSQGTGKSISLDDFNSEELVDYQSALEYVNGSLQLNAERVKEISDAKADEKLATIETTKALEQAKYLENAREIERLTSRYDELTIAELDTLASLQNEQSQIVSNCTQYDLMAASIREATGAYQSWLDAQNTSESGDMYDDAQSAMEAIKEGLESGKTGTNKYEAAVEFLIPDDIPKSEVDGYMDKLKRYLGDSDAGTDNFLNDAVEAGLMSVEDGYYSVIDGIKMSDFVDKLHITPEMAQAIFGELEEYDFEFDWGDEQFATYGDGITALAMSASELQTELDKLYADKEAGIEVDDSEIDALEQKLDEVNQKKAELEQASVVNIESNIEIDSAISEAEQDVQGWKAAVEADPANIEAQTNLENAEAKLAELQQQKSELQEPTVVEITAAISDIDSQIASTKQEIDNLSNKEYLVKYGISEDTATSKISELNTQLDSLNEKKAEIQAYAETTGAMSDLEALENKKVNDKKFDVTAIDNATRVINSINRLTLTDKSFTITTNKVTNEVSTGGGPVNGTANASGTANSLKRIHSQGRAYAKGNWGNPKRQTVLIGELGREIVVDPNTGRWRTYGDNGAEFADIPKNAIVFNHLQSESLLERGFVTGRGTIKNGAFASGTAFVTGGGKKGANSGSSYTGSGSTTTTTTTTKTTKNTGSTSTAKSKKDNQDYVDWIERAIEKIQRKIQKFQTVAENIYKSFKDRNTALKNQISSVSDEIDIQQKAYDRYMAQANAVKLDSSLKKKVKNGTIDINAYGEKTREKIQEYQDWYDKAQDCKQAIDDLNVSLTELYRQQFDNIITKWENKLQDLEHAAERTESVISRRSDYASEYVAPENAKEASESNITSYKDLISNAQSQIEKRASELVELRKNLNDALSNPDSGITEGSEGHKEMLAEIQSVESEIDSLNSDIIGYSNSISEEYMNMFDGVAQGYENKLAQAEHLANEYNHALEMAEAKGYQTSAQYYEMLRGIEEENVTLLKEEYDALMNSMSTALSSGEIEEGSQAYYDMTEQINGVAEAIQEAELNIVEFNNSIRETQWEQFDYLQDRISKVSDEIEFMNELMSNSDMFTDKGKFTDTGMATLGMYGMNYNTLMRQADDYAAEIKKINAEIANDPANTTLIERKDELLEKQRELILAAEDEKQAIKDLVSDGIKAEIDSLKELADNYVSALESQKDLYDFQKKVAEQTKNIASLEKQLQAYQNDTTEEARAKIQKISVELSDAKSDLEETQYEHYISETKKILDDMTIEYEKVLNERLDNLDMLIEEMIATANSNAVTIDATLREVADSVGYTMSEQMTSTWTNVATQMVTDAAQRVDDTNRLVNQLVSNGAISQQNAASIISALANGDAQAMQNTISIVNGLLANGQLSSENATAILTSMSNGDQLAIANALDIITKLTENGTLAQADAASIVSGLVVGDELSKLNAEQTINKLSENGQLSKENATALSTALSTCTGEGSVLATYSKDFNTKLTSLNTTLDGIKTYTDSLQKKAADEAAAAKAKADAEAAAKAAAEKAAAEAAAKAASTKAAAQAATTNTVTETAKKEAETTKSTTTTTTKTTTTNDTSTKKTSTGTQGDGKIQVGDKVKFNSGKYYENSYGQGNSGYQKRGSQVYITKINKSGTHPYHISTGKKLGSGDLGWLKKSQISGYASGAKRIQQDGLAWINENWDKNGGETYLRKSDKAVLTTVGMDDRIYNAMASENLWKAANNPGRFVMDNLSSAQSSIDNQPSEAMQKYLSLTENSGNTTIGDINIEMDLSGIADYEEFMQKMQNDKKFAKLIQSISLGAMLGRNPQDKYKIKW